MNATKKAYTTPEVEALHLHLGLPSLLASTSTESSGIEADWLEFGDVEDQGEWEGTR